MYVDNTNIVLLIYIVYNYEYSFGENKNKRTLIVKLKETRNFSSTKNKFTIYIIIFKQILLVLISKAL